MKKSKGLFSYLLTVIFILLMLFPATASNAATGKVRLNMSSLTTYEDYTDRLKLNNASGTITWSSSDKNVAEVSSAGVVTGKRAGTATITARNNGTSYSCKVTVKKCSDGLEFERINGGYEVRGIGRCTDTDIIIPKKYGSLPVISIGENAFKDLNPIEKEDWTRIYYKVSIPDSVTKIADYAFYNAAVTNVSIPNSVTRIGEYAFSHSSIQEIVIPDSVYMLGEGAFEASALTKITLSKSLSVIENDTFYDCHRLKSITIPKEVKKICDNVFEKCYSLSTVLFNNGLESIGEKAFYESGSGLRITIPDSVTNISEDAFKGSDVRSFVFSKNLKTIEKQMFEGCGYLESVVIPEGVTTIEREAFCGDASLFELTIPSSITSIGEKAFTESVKKVYVVKGSYAERFIKKEYPEINVSYIDKSGANNKITITGMENTADGIKFKWNYNGTCTGFRIYRKNRYHSYELIGKVSNIFTYTDKNIENGETYSYIVVPFSKQGEENIYAGKTIKRLDPIVITSVNRKGSELVVTVSENEKAKGYQISYSTDSSFSASATKSVTVYGYGQNGTITGLSSNKKYYIRVRPYYLADVLWDEHAYSYTTYYYGAYSSVKTVGADAGTSKKSIKMSNVSTVSATSTLVENGYSYSASYLIDGVTSTAWSEGVSGYGEGESITLKFDDEYIVSGLYINNGFQKDKTRYNKNSRPKKIRLSFSDGSSQEYTLDDYYGRQTVALKNKIETSFIKMEILSVYTGTTYKDTLVSEIKLY
ncbi:MAG: leucine-rich repeat protein [Lachnospiraceae bacterium]|nr:leucine-rich repeat protein [Lachnospiraceae bacterium]